MQYERDGVEKMVEYVLQSSNDESSVNEVETEEGEESSYYSEPDSSSSGTQSQVDCNEDDWMNEDEVLPEEQEGIGNVDRKHTKGLARGSSHTKDPEGEKPQSNTPKAGMIVANFNMAGNFNISITVNLVMDQNIHILTIQECSLGSKALRVQLCRLKKNLESSAAQTCRLGSSQVSAKCFCRVPAPLPGMEYP